MDSYDVDMWIENALSSGPKAPDELLNLVLKNAKVNPRTYYRHLEKLLKNHVIETLMETNEGFKPDLKYKLTEQKKASLLTVLDKDVVGWVGYASGGRGLRKGDIEISFPPPKALLELAAWIQHSPDGWNNDDLDIKQAMLCLEETSHLVPGIGHAREDPDSYAFVWSKDALTELNLCGDAFSRFFNYKTVFNSVKTVSSSLVDQGKVFLAAFCSTVDNDQLSVIIAVRREGVCLHVMHMESHSATLDKAWVKAISKQLNAKVCCMLNEEKMKDTTKREALITLRTHFEQQTLTIPHKYRQLILNLQDFSYSNPVDAFVLALALVVQNSTKIK
jgi:DNA-binding PadR family transcriptional regulator